MALVVKKLMNIFWYTVFWLLAVSTININCEVKKPNIVFIIADDLGWNDVSLHGSDQILTPNIDLLGLSGVVLGRYYSHAMCTPSRAALLTGKYSHKTGMQGRPMLMTEDRGIPMSEKLLPQYFKEAGYVTHLVGKWHVGLSRNEHLPTSRGFDSHFGHRGGFLDYNEYTIDETFEPVGTVSGLALYRNLTAAWDVQGYITDVYNNHAKSLIDTHDVSSPLFLMVSHNAPHASNKYSNLQAPPEDVRKMRHVELASRRIFAAMVKKLDDSVGDIVQTLHRKGILDNTIIVFISDNGGATQGKHQNWASNYPLRGLKSSPFEGGVRVVGSVWSSNLNKSGYRWDGYMHVSDWIPTLLTAAGIKIPSGIDGINHWESINFNEPSKRQVMYEIDDYAGYAALTLGDYKLITGIVDKVHGNYHGGDLRGIIGKAPSYTDAIRGSKVYQVLELFGRPFKLQNLSMRKNMEIKCREIPKYSCTPSKEAVCLYNIIKDPCERTDLSNDYAKLVQKLKLMLKKEFAARIPRKLPLYQDPLAVPGNFNSTWHPWLPNSE